MTSPHRKTDSKQESSLVTDIDPEAITKDENVLGAITRGTIDGLHLALNMWALWDGGRLVERLYGRLRFAVLYIGSGVAGNMYLYPVTGASRKDMVQYGYPATGNIAAGVTGGCRGIGGK